MKYLIRRYVSILLTVCLLCTATPLPTQALTIGEEEDLSRAFLMMVRRQAVIIEDPEIQHYLSSLGYRVLEAFPEQPFKYNFYMIRSDVYNAFAAPGGQVFIHSGLFEALSSEDEIAGILGHEIAHVHCRHLSERIDQSQKIGLLTMAGMLAGVFLGVGGAAAIGSAVAIGSSAAGQSLTLAFSRENEMQADQIGLKYLNDAGYSGAGLLDALKVIRSKEWFGSEQIPTYLSTHPASEERIAMIGTWVAESEKVVPGPPVDPDNFLRTRARLAALYGDEGIQLKRLGAAVKKSPDDLISRYGHALVLSRSGSHDMAISEIKKVIAKDPLNPSYVKALGMIYYNAGEYDDALKILEMPQVGGLKDPQARLYYAKSLIKTGDAKHAQARLEDLARDYPEYTPVYYVLGEVSEKLKKQADADYYLGVYEYRIVQFKKAKFHLEKALSGGLEEKIKRDQAEKYIETIKGVMEKVGGQGGKKRLASGMHITGDSGVLMGGLNHMPH